ncbi:MAG: hypothetical protein SWK76_15175 [Actinomycetota bacterium]|nr:hypothetical protein [Actinomycetota bacterium]
MGFEGVILSDEYREKRHLFSGMQFIRMITQQQHMEEDTRKRVVEELR